jgi:hypothetical protein
MKLTCTVHIKVNAKYFSAELCSILANACEDSENHEHRYNCFSMMKATVHFILLPAFLQ